MVGPGPERYEKDDIETRGCRGLELWRESDWWWDQIPIGVSVTMAVSKDTRNKSSQTFNITNINQ